MTFDDMVLSDSIEIAASAEAVYDVVSNVTRVGEWSPETHTGAWTQEAAPVVGARFKGTNKTDAFERATPCVVTAAERGNRFAFDVIGGDDGNGASWSWDIEPSGDGVTLTQRFEIGPSLGGFRGFGRGKTDDEIDALVTNRIAELRAGMATSLARVKALAEPS
ncbi:MAG TPA: SRPBCC family protein [Acidimicrobiales bacterium]|nr:SRPBCC family protein [Acidimicrobiales bacterium]